MSRPFHRHNGSELGKRMPYGLKRFNRMPQPVATRARRHQSLTSSDQCINWIIFVQNLLKMPPPSERDNHAKVILHGSSPCQYLSPTSGILTTVYWADDLQVGKTELWILKLFKHGGFGVTLILKENATTCYNDTESLMPGCLKTFEINTLQAFQPECECITRKRHVRLVDERDRNSGTG